MLKLVNLGKGNVGILYYYDFSVYLKLFRKV